MTLSRTFTPQLLDVSRGTAVTFSDLAVYRFCMVFAVFDYLDILDFTDYNDIIKYGYALILVVLMAIYFLRWKRVDATIAPLILLFFFLVTASAFVANYFIYDERQSYVSAFIAPLTFSLSIFIPPNSIMIEARKILKHLTFLLSAGTVFYMIEAIIKPLNFVSNLTNVHEVQVHKSLICVLALCLSVLSSRKILTVLLAIVTTTALLLRPMSTLVLALICCLPIAILLRPRISTLRPLTNRIASAIAMTILGLAVAIPLLLYFYFDDISELIASGETYLKSDILGAQSNMAFRLAILKYAFTAIDNASVFIFGAGLSSSHTVPLGQLPGWQHWYAIDPNGVAPIHSDFVVVFVLMGIIGYFFLSAAFYLILRTRFRELDRRGLDANSFVLQAVSIIAALAILIYCSDEPYLSYYNHANIVWLLLLISEIARKSKVVNPDRSQTIAPELSTIQRRSQ